MNKFHSGFTLGFLVSTSLAIGYFFLTKPISKTEEFDSVQKTSPIIAEPYLNSKSSTSQHEKEFKPKTPDLSSNKTLSQADKTAEHLETDALEPDPNALPDQNDLKKRIQDKLDTFNQNDLARIENILNQLNALPPKKLFENESIDPIWAEQKQVELEYSYYNDSQLKDIGDLESIRCKSQHCQVKVQILKGEKLKPSYYMDWSNPVSVRITPNQNNPASQTIEIYIPREGKPQ